MNRTILFSILLVVLAGFLFFLLAFDKSAAPIEGESSGGMAQPNGSHTQSGEAVSSRQLGATHSSTPSASSRHPDVAVPSSAGRSARVSQTAGDDSPLTPQQSNEAPPSSPASAGNAMADTPQAQNTAAAATVAAALGIPMQDTYTPPSNIIYEIEAGMRAPVALLPHDKPMSPQVAGALESIRQDFDNAVSSAPDPAAVWDAARKRADEEYKMFFGFEAYNQRAMQDAIDALESRKAQP